VAAGVDRLRGRRRCVGDQLPFGPGPVSVTGCPSAGSPWRSPRYHGPGNRYRVQSLPSEVRRAGTGSRLWPARLALRAGCVSGRAQVCASDHDRAARWLPANPTGRTVGLQSDAHRAPDTHRATTRTRWSAGNARAAYRFCRAAGALCCGLQPMARPIGRRLCTPHRRLCALSTGCRGRAAGTAAAGAAQPPGGRHRTGLGAAGRTALRDDPLCAGPVRSSDTFRQPHGDGWADHADARSGRRTTAGAAARVDARRWRAHAADNPATAATALGRQARAGVETHGRWHDNGEAHRRSANTVRQVGLATLCQACGSKTGTQAESHHSPCRQTRRRTADTVGQTDRADNGQTWGRKARVQADGRGLAHGQTRRWPVDTSRQTGRATSRQGCGREARAWANGRFFPGRQTRRRTVDTVRQTDSADDRQARRPEAGAQAGGRWFSHHQTRRWPIDAIRQVGHADDRQARRYQARTCRQADSR
jgi:hypothetical protein